MANKPSAMSPARITDTKPSFSNVFWVSPSPVFMGTSHCIRLDEPQWKGGRRYTDVGDS